MNESNEETTTEIVEEPKAVTQEEQALLLTPVEPALTDKTTKQFFIGVVGFFLLAIATLVIAYQSGVFGNQNSLNYTFLDKSVLLPYEVEEWSKDVIQNQGVFIKETPMGTYALISAGTRHTAGYQIAIHAIDTKKKDVTIQYEIITPSKTEEVQTETEVYAYAWVLFAETGLTITSTEVTTIANH